MEILLTTAAFLALVLLAILLGTKGRPTVLISHIRTAAESISGSWIQITVLGSLVILVGLLVYFYYIMPGAGAGPLQPIAFSHRLHAGHKKIDCRFCHPYADRSTYPGIPPVEKCLYCHNHIITQHPEIRKEHAYFDTNTPTPWKKVFHVPEHVLFNHERHIKKEIDCEKCHGDVKATDRLKYHAFKMGFCVECHREKNANLDCWLSCHN